jgi:hypothetical protein
MIAADYAKIAFKLEILPPRSTDEESKGTFFLTYFYPDNEIYNFPNGVNFTKKSMQLPDFSLHAPFGSLGLSNWGGGGQKSGGLSRILERTGSHSSDRKSQSLDITW